MADISLTSGMRANLLQLQMTERFMDRTQQRISTGKKVNSALDGPAAYFAAKALTDRAADLTSLKEGMGQAISTIKAADQAISKITDLVGQAKALANTANSNLGDDAASVASRKSSAAQFDVLMTQIDDMVSDASYAGKNLLLGDGSAITLGATAKADLEAEGGIAALGVSVSASTSADTYKVDTLEGQFGRISTSWDGDAEATAWTGTANITGKAIMSDLVITGPLGGTAANYDVSIALVGTGTATTDATTITVTYDGATYSQDMADGSLANAFDIDIQGLNIKFSMDDVGGSTNVTTAVSVAVLTATSTDQATDQRLEITSSGDKVTGELGVVTLSSYAEDLTRTAGSTLLEDSATTSTVFSTGTVVIKLDTDITAFVDAQSNTLITTATAATNLNDLTVNFNADASSNINIDSINTNSSAGLGVSGAIGEWAAASDISTALTQIDAALSTLRDTGQTLATNLSVVQTREDFTAEFVTTLEEGADKWTLADANLEGANMLMLQTRQQLGTVSLSIASQSAQSILRLFG